MEVQLSALKHGIECIQRGENRFFVLHHLVGPSEGEPHLPAPARDSPAHNSPPPTVWVNPMDGVEQPEDGSPARAMQTPAFVGRFRRAWQYWMLEFVPSYSADDMEAKWLLMVNYLVERENYNPDSVVWMLRLFEQQVDMDPEVLRETVEGFLWEHEPPNLSPRATRSNSLESQRPRRGSTLGRTPSDDERERNIELAVDGTFIPEVEDGEMHDNTERPVSRGTTSPGSGNPIDQLPNGVAPDSEDETDDKTVVESEGEEADEDQNEPMPQVTAADEETYSDLIDYDYDPDGDETMPSFSIDWNTIDNNRPQVGFPPREIHSPQPQRFSTAAAADSAIQRLQESAQITSNSDAAWHSAIFKIGSSESSEDGSSSKHGGSQGDSSSKHGGSQSGPSGSESSSMDANRVVNGFHYATHCPGIVTGSEYGVMSPYDSISSDHSEEGVKIAGSAHDQPNSDHSSDPFVEAVEREGSVHDQPETDELRSPSADVARRESHGSVQPASPELPSVRGRPVQSSSAADVSDADAAGQDAAAPTPWRSRNPWRSEKYKTDEPDTLRGWICRILGFLACGLCGILSVWGSTAKRQPSVSPETQRNPFRQASDVEEVRPLVRGEGNRRSVRMPSTGMDLPVIPESSEQSSEDIDVARPSEVHQMSGSLPSQSIEVDDSPASEAADEPHNQEGDATDEPFSPSSAAASTTAVRHMAVSDSPTPLSPARTASSTPGRSVRSVSFSDHDVIMPTPNETSQPVRVHRAPSMRMPSVLKRHGLAETLASDGIDTTSSQTETEVATSTRSFKELSRLSAPAERDEDTAAYIQSLRREEEGLGSETEIIEGVEPSEAQQVVIMERTPLSTFANGNMSREHGPEDQTGTPPADPAQATSEPEKLEASSNGSTAVRPIAHDTNHENVRLSPSSGRELLHDAEMPDLQDGTTFPKPCPTMVVHVPDEPVGVFSGSHWGLR